MQTVSCVDETEIHAFFVTITALSLAILYMPRFLRGREKKGNGGNGDKKVPFHCFMLFFLYSITNLFKNGHVLFIYFRLHSKILIITFFVIKKQIFFLVVFYKERYFQKNTFETITMNYAKIISNN